MNFKNMLSDRSQKITYCYDLIYIKIHNRQIQRDRRQEVVAKSWGEEQRGNWLLMGTGSPSGMMEYFGIRVVHHGLVLNASKLNTLKWLLYYENFNFKNSNVLKSLFPL